MPKLIERQEFHEHKTTIFNYRLALITDPLIPLLPHHQGCRLNLNPSAC